MQINIERQTGRKYILVRRYADSGRCMDRQTLRRYNVVKQYV